MKMNRRNVLAGLGTAAVGTGAAFGSGAFTSVEADRTVEVGVAEDDDSGIVALDPNDDTSDYLTNTDGTFEIELPDVNRDASVELGDVFDIRNNTGDDDGDTIEVWAEVDEGPDEWANALIFEIDDEVNDVAGVDNIVNEGGEEDPDFVELDNDSADDENDATVSVRVDTEEDGFDGEEEDLEAVTFHAEPVTE